MTHQASPIRHVRLGNMAATADRRPDGTIILQSSAALGAYRLSMRCPNGLKRHPTPC
jgi:feruloyl-CoA synthase